jgi:hypothetical protein
VVKRKLEAFALYIDRSISMPNLIGHDIPDSEEAVDCRSIAQPWKRARSDRRADGKRSE